MSLFFLSSLPLLDDKLLTRRALHPEYSKTESDAQTEAMDVDETETKSEPAVPAADAAAAAAGTATPSKTEAKEWDDCNS